MGSVLAEWRAARARTSPRPEAPPVAAEGPARDITTIDDFALTMGQLYNDAASAWGFGPSQVQWHHEPAERVSHSFEGYARQLVEGNGAVAAIMGVRTLAFSLVRFQYQRMRGSRGTTLFGMPSLSLLETPYPGGSTQDFLMRLMQDADLAGNAYTTNVIGPDGPELMRLRPDWVQIILMPVETSYGGFLGWRRVGYTYHDGGIEQCPPERVALFDVKEVAHFAPDPDPFARYRGQSWLTAVLREIINDKMMEKHKTKFFENAATPNISVALSDQVTPAQFQEFKEKMNLDHRGVNNAYKTLFLGGGADVKVIGANLQQIDFDSIQGRGESRMAARAGVPPVIVGLTEGLKQATYSNYGQAMRRFGDLTMASLWANVCSSMQTLVPSPGADARLWYDTRDIAFLRDDAKSRAEVQQVRAATINIYITAGFEPSTAVAAAVAEDETLLVHTGLTSVQLQPPGTSADGTSTTGTDTGGDTGGDADDDADPDDTPAPATSAGGTNAAAAPALVRGAEPPETGPTDAVDRVLVATNGHPHPRLSPDGKD